MTNGERYKTAQERVEAFSRFCNSFDDDCHGCPVADDCSMKDDIAGSFAWLDLEAEEEKPETIEDIIADMRKCDCYKLNGGCADCQGFDCRDARRFADRIEAAYNRVAKKCMEGK